jgi:hypothetical protein
MVEGPQCRLKALKIKAALVLQRLLNVVHHNKHYFCHAFALLMSRSIHRKATLFPWVLLILPIVFASGPATPPVAGCPSPDTLVVVHGDARFTILTESIIRLERTPFVNECSFTFTNRAPLSTPIFTHSINGSGTLQIKTAKVELEYTPTRTASSCSEGITYNNTDADGSLRSSKYPDGLVSATREACCAACLQDHSCTAYIFADSPTPKGKDCWPLKGFKSMKSEVNRTLVMSAGGRSAFSRNELSITIIGDANTEEGFSGATWRPGDIDTQNLGGTISSWNEVDVRDLGTKMQQGILSRSGWALVDDTSTRLFESSNVTNPGPLFAGSAPWNKHETTARTSADWYFLGCGLRYKECLGEWVELSGAIAMPPRAAFGVWWSHYEAYSSTTIQTDVLAGYANYSLPLNVLQMDVNWHVQQVPPVKDCKAFNGYDWSPELFPDPHGYYS